MPHIFEVKDTSGRIIHLSHERWSHIVQKHDDLSGNMGKVRETIEHPLLITKEKDDKNVYEYYRFYKALKKYLIVAVKYLNGKGFIMTSYFKRKIQ